MQKVTGSSPVSSTWVVVDARQAFTALSDQINRCVVSAGEGSTECKPANVTCHIYILGV